MKGHEIVALVLDENYQRRENVLVSEGYEFITTVEARSADEACDKGQYKNMGFGVLIIGVVVFGLLGICLM